MNLKSDTKLSEEPIVYFMGETYLMFSKNRNKNLYAVFIPIYYYIKNIKYDVNVFYKLDDKYIKRWYINAIYDNYKKMR